MNHRSIRRSTATAAATALALASLLGACGDDSDDAADTTTSVAATEPTTDTTAPTQEGMVISGMWARTSPAMATAGAIYLEISNNTEVDDALISASVDPSIAETVELHQTTMEPAPDDSTTDGSEESPMSEGSGMGGAGTADDTSDGDGTGMMKMAPVEEIPVPAGATAVLQPGGYHIMLLDLVAPLEVGSTIEVTLTFANAGEVLETADVLDTAP